MFKQGENDERKNPDMVKSRRNDSLKDIDSYIAGFVREVKEQKEYLWANKAGMGVCPFNFMFATECFEHFFNPAVEIERIVRLLKPGGLLIVMTHLWEEGVDFASWYYPKDPTHVTFYHSETFKFIEKMFGFRQLPAASERVIILRLGAGQRVIGDRYYSLRS